MDNFSSQCQAIVCFKRCSHSFKPKIKSKVSFLKMLMEISVRGINNYMIKPYDNGGLESVVYSVTHKLLISDTTLRSFMLPQVLKTTAILRQICGY